ncbi:hypothetical protein [Subtercola boreus]|uniref:Uncharacterized protein n=1 Tax=Subtercola boreus TaxID=120213 RepID=A0A3E0WFX6_9MICO|nr:hypothetical protein [Subtercola boreus]RFA23344.1 hypothetical protein B7R24_00070 [Subtercola boreus]RFA23737.1 hypothetical protein B7R23_00070 [Subtercola boreus]RFA29437.1 hypothetical protein B7R25_00065 [Subtercola boreus]
MDDRTALTRDLTDLVRLIPGVAAVYSSGPVVVEAVSAVTQVVLRGAVAHDVVAVAEANGGLTVSVTIGVSEGLPATEVCRQVYDAIAERLLLGGMAETASIAVKVARIG